MLAWLMATHSTVLTDWVRNQMTPVAVLTKPSRSCALIASWSVGSLPANSRYAGIGSLFKEECERDLVYAPGIVLKVAALR